MTDFTLNASFTRLANTTAYAAGQVIAQSATPATAALALPFTVTPGRQTTCWRNRSVALKKSTSSVALATYVLHLFRDVPALVGGDAAAFSVPNLNDYAGSVPVDMSSGATTGIAVSGEIYKQFNVNAPELYIDTVKPIIYGVLVAGAAYVPGSSEIFSVMLGMSRA